MQTRRWTVIIILCVTVVAVLAGIKTLQIREAIAFAKSFPEHSETVKASIVQKISWAPTTKAMGEVRAPQTIELRNELEGKIVAVNFKPGADVVKNQLLVQLDVSQETAQLRAAQAEAELAKLELERYQKLINDKLASKEQFDRARAQSAVALAQVQSLRAIIDKKTLKAPFDAYAGLHDLDVGQYLPSNSLVTQLVGATNEMWIDFSLPQEQASLEIGTVIKVNAPGLLNDELTGVVFAKDALVEQQSRNLRFRGLIKGATRQLKPGAIVEVTIPSAQVREVTVLPVTAVRRDQFGANVYALIPEKNSSLETIRARKKSVTLGPVLGNKIVILNGVNVGEKIATDGSYKLRDAMLVTIESNLEVGAVHE